MSLDRQLCSVVVLGGAGVGKTSFINNYLSAEFTEPEATYHDEVHESSETVRGQEFTLRIVDVGGDRDMYQRIQDEQARQADAAILFYSAHDETSVDELNHVVHLAQENHLPFAIVCTKTDLKTTDASEALLQEGKRVAERLGCEHFEASAKKSTNIKETFTHIVCKICDKRGIRSDEVRHQGWMKKQAPGMIKRWKRRYFLLRANAKLDYFEDRERTVKKGTADLTKMTALERTPNKNKINVKCPDRKRADRTWVLETETEDECNEWMEALQQFMRSG